MQLGLLNSDIEEEAGSQKVSQRPVIFTLAVEMTH